MSITGLPDGEPGGGPMRVGVAVADLFTGMYTCVAILAALLPAREDRRGRAHRHGAVRHAAGDARQPGVERADFGRGPAAAGQHPSQYRALPAVRRGRSADHHRRRQRPPVRAAGGDLRPSRMGRATSASRPMARGSPTATRSCGWSPSASRAKPAAEWLEQLEAAGIPAGPINRISQALADVQAQHRGRWCGRSRGSAAGRLAGADRRRARRFRPAAARAWRATDEVLRELGWTRTSSSG